MTVGHNGGPPIREGNWIAISRDIIDHHIVGAGNMVTPDDKNRGSFSRLESWLDLLSMASFAERKINVAGATMILRPGQTLAGRAFLAKRWNWTEKAVRVWLVKLEAELMITLACEKLKEGQTKGHGPNVLSVCNWAKYQIETVEQGPDLGRPQGHPRATQGPHYNKETREQEREEGNTPLPPKGGVPPLDVLRAFEAYNELALRTGLPQAAKLTPDRHRKIAARLKDYGLDGWGKALDQIERSAFLTGQNDRQWRASLDFLCQPTSFSRVHDGGYGNGRHAGALASETAHERTARFVDEALARMGQPVVRSLP